MCVYIYIYTAQVFSVDLSGTILFFSLNYCSAMRYGTMLLWVSKCLIAIKLSLK